MPLDHAATKREDRREKRGSGIVGLQAARAQAARAQAARAQAATPTESQLSPGPLAP
eukprot:COSAG01_NODE_4657_length_4843_cov_5.437395_2_plen_57_part_00